MFLVQCLSTCIAHLSKRHVNILSLTSLTYLQLCQHQTIIKNFITYCYVCILTPVGFVKKDEEFMV